MAYCTHQPRKDVKHLKRVEPSVLMEAAAELLPIAARLAHESVVGIQAALGRCPIMRLIENWQGGAA